MITNKTAAIFIFLCPTAYCMQNPEEINQALIVAAHAHNVFAYRQAAREAIVYAESHPQNIDELLPGIHLNTVTPDIAGHALAIGYGVATNNPMHTAVCTISALISAGTLRPTRTENQDNWGTITRILSYSILNGITLAIESNYSWQGAIPALLRFGIRTIPYLREETIDSEQYHLAQRLNEIDIEYLEYRRPRDILILNILNNIGFFDEQEDNGARPQIRIINLPQDNTSPAA